MQNGYKGNQSFRTSTRQTNFARVSAAANHNRETQVQQERLWRKFFAYGKDLPRSYRKLISRAAVCLVLALGILGIKTMDTQLAGQISQGLEEQTQQEELGRLQFVTSGQSLAYSLPLEGEVVQSFAESDKDVSIKGEAQAEVKAILDGTVIQTSPDSIVINNVNGTQTTYTGLQPQVLAGDTVQSAQVIGCLNEEVLCLETVSGIGYVDSLDAVQLEQATAQIES